MPFAEYSLVFISILVGYVVTVAMAGWGKFIKHYDYKLFSVAYLSWSLSLFFYLLFIWLWTFKGFSKNLDYLDSPLSLYLSIVRLLIIYLAIETLTPDDAIDYNFKKHFFKASKKFYVILIVLWSFELLLYPLTNHWNLNLRSGIYLTNLPIAIALLFIKSERVQNAIAAFCVLGHEYANITVLDYF